MKHALQVKLLGKHLAFSLVFSQEFFAKKKKYIKVCIVITLSNTFSSWMFYIWNINGITKL